MSKIPSGDLLGRDSEIGLLSSRVRTAVERLLLPLSVILAIEAIYLSYSSTPGATAFLLIALSSAIGLRVWCSDAIGLPLLPVLALQSLFIYGVPIVAGHSIIQTYPPDFVLRAGEEVLIFNLTMAFAWKLAMQVFLPSPPVCHALREVNKEGSKGWSRLGFVMIAATTAYSVLGSLGLTDPIVSLLPTGSSSILAALVAVASASGFFLVSMAVAGTETSFLGKVVFWLLLIVNGMLSASEFLLYSVAANLITVAVGFFWSRGRIPWRYLVVSMLCLSFLNTGKTTMRERYWGSDSDSPPPATFSRLPKLYSEWLEVSFNAVMEKEGPSGRDSGQGNVRATENQTLLDRIDNLQNLLFVIDAMETNHIPPLHGATYALIPPLLVPRVLAPNKPRSHEGQILLNVHFGRQDLNSTYSTYIAWGLLPEAYGNFGAILGSSLLGIAAGIFCAWIENLTARKLIVSTEGFLSLSLLMAVINSFEMVASVLVTETFQSFIIIIFASMPFVRRTVTRSGAPIGT